MCDRSGTTKANHNQKDRRNGICLFSHLTWKSRERHSYKSPTGAQLTSIPSGLGGLGRRLIHQQRLNGFTRQRPLHRLISMPQEGRYRIVGIEVG